MLPSQPDLVGRSQHQLSGGYRFLTSMMRVQVSMGASDIKICYDAMSWDWVFIARSMVTQGGARAVQAYHNGTRMRVQKCMPPMSPSPSPSLEKNSTHVSHRHIIKVCEESLSPFFLFFVAVLVVVPTFTAALLTLVSFLFILTQT